MLTLGTPIARAAIAATNIRTTNVDHVGLNVTLTVDRFDAQGNLLDTVQVPLGPVAAAAWIAAVKASLYTQYEAAANVSGTVT